MGGDTGSWFCAIGWGRFAGVGTEPGCAGAEEPCPSVLSSCTVTPHPPLEHISSPDGAWMFGVALWELWGSTGREWELGTVTLRCQAGLSSSLLSPNPYSLSFPCASQQREGAVSISFAFIFHLFLFSCCFEGLRTGKKWVWMQKKKKLSLGSVAQGFNEHKAQDHVELFNPEGKRARKGLWMSRKVRNVCLLHP